MHRILLPRLQTRASRLSFVAIPITGVRGHRGASASPTADHSGISGGGLAATLSRQGERAVEGAEARRTWGIGPRAQPSSFAFTSSWTIPGLALPPVAFI